MGPLREHEGLARDRDGRNARTAGQAGADQRWQQRDRAGHRAPVSGRGLAGLSGRPGPARGGQRAGRPETQRRGVRPGLRREPRGRRGTDGGGGAPGPRRDRRPHQQRWHRAARPVPGERGGGVIINMSSTNGLAGEEEYAHYNASKGGVLLLTKTMAVELGKHGIRVNALCPGYIRTPLNEAIAAGIGGADFEAAYVRDRIPLGRAGRAEDVAAAYAFLASDDAAFIHGSALVIDGGQLAVM